MAPPQVSFKVQWVRKGGKEVPDSKVSRQGYNGSNLEFFTPGTRVLDRPPGKCALTSEQTDALAAAIITTETWGSDEQQQARARQCLRRHGLDPNAFSDKWSTMDNKRAAAEHTYVFPVRVFSRKRARPKSDAAIVLSSYRDLRARHGEGKFIRRYITFQCKCGIAPSEAKEGQVSFSV